MEGEHGCVHACKGVDELIEALGAARDTEVPVPSWHYEEAQARTGSTMPLYEALSKCYDLRCACAALA